MAKKLKIGLPVMLHSEPEVQAFLRAKDRIEAYGDVIGQPLDVGAFLFFIPPALKDENMAKQLENQSKYRLPIVHAQSTFQSKHCLSFSAEQDSESQGIDLMDVVVKQVAALRTYDPLRLPVDVSVNVGLYLSRRKIEPKSPVIYTPEEFPAYREKLFRKSVARFSQLEELARSYDLGVAVENGVTAIFAHHVKLTDKIPSMFVHPFNDLASLVAISNGKLVLDLAHLAGTRCASEFFEKNRVYEDREVLFKMEGITSWDEYLERNPGFESYLPYSRVLHMSNATGLGVYLEGEFLEKWGNVGTIEGIVPREDFHKIVSHAKENNKPVIIEVEYDVKNIPQNNYKEADALLEYILT